MGILIYLIVVLLSLVVQAVFGALAHIQLLDGAALGGAAALACHYVLGVHPALCLVIFLAVMVGLGMLQAFPVSFWIVSTLFSLSYGTALGWIVYDTCHDLIWTVVLGVLAAGGAMLLHCVHQPN